MDWSRRAICHEEVASVFVEKEMALELNGGDNFNLVAARNEGTAADRVEQLEATLVGQPQLRKHAPRISQFR